jgi:Mitochondrial carrier protein
VAFQMSTAKHGLRGLYAGMAPNVLQVLPSSALSYFTYELMKVVLDVRE